MDSVRLVSWRILLAWCLWVSGTHSESQHFTSTPGFNVKFMATKQQLTNTFYLRSTGKNGAQLNLSTLWMKSLGEMYSRNETQVPKHVLGIVRTQNQTLVLTELDVWCLKRENLERKVSLPSSLRGQDIQLIKGIEWEQTLFFLICSKNNDCKLFTVTPEFEFTYRQSISDGGIPVAAEFFVQQNNLFLIMNYQAFSSQISQTRIYRWHEVYLDYQELSHELTSTASSITLFNYKDSIIFVLGCSAVDKMQFPTQVWRREPSGEVRKVHYLPTLKPLSITHYMERGEHFILVVEENERAHVYWWEGNEFVLWMDVDEMLQNFKVFISNNAINRNLMVFTSGMSLRIYMMTSRRLEQIYATQLSSTDPYEIISVLNLSIFEENGKTYLILLSQTHHQVYVTLFRMDLHFSHSSYSVNQPNITEEPSSKQQQVAPEVIRDLESQMQSLATILPSLLLTNRQTTIDNTVSIVSDRTDIQSGEIFNLTHIHSGIARLVRNVSSKMNKTRAEINLHSSTLHSMEGSESKHIYFEGVVLLQEANMTSMVVEMLNGYKYKPDSLLSISDSQTLKRIKAKTLDVHWLVLSEIRNTPIKDLLLMNSTLHTSLKTTHLKSKDLQIKEEAKINNIMFKDLINRTVKSENWNEHSFNTIPQVVSGKELGNVVATTVKLQDNTIIENLIVDQLNNVNISDFVKSLFVKKTYNVIHGNLHFKKGLRVNQVLTKSSNLPLAFGSENLLHITPNPEHNSNFEQEKLKRNTPTNERAEKFSGYEDNTRKHIHKVKIIGNLKVDRILFKNSLLRTKRHTVPTDELPRIFWTLSTPQVIPKKVHFSCGVTLLHGLESPIVNGRNLTHYTTTKSKFHSLNLRNVHISGNISARDVKIGQAVLNQTILRNRLENLNFNVLEVKHLHTRFINGNPFVDVLQQHHFLNNDLKIITENLKISGDMSANLINDINVQKKFEMAAFINEDCNLSAVDFSNISEIVEKSDESLRLCLDPTSEKELQSMLGLFNYFRDFVPHMPTMISPLRELLKKDSKWSWLPIHSECVLKLKQAITSAPVLATFDSQKPIEVHSDATVSADIKNMNNYTVSDMLGLMNQNSSVRLDGKLHLSQLRGVALINNKLADFNLVVNKKKPSIINGKKSFPDQVLTMNDIKVTNINNRSMEELFGNLLSKSKDQVVSGFYSLKTATMQTLSNVSQINDINISELVYVNQPKVNLRSDITLATFIVEGHVSVSTLLDNCVLPKKVEEELVFENATSWSSLLVTGDANWPNTQGSQLQQLFDSAVTKDEDQTISGNVCIQFLNSRSVRVKLLNDKNITFIFQDSLSRKNTNQVILGKKFFTGYIKCSSIEVEGDARLKSVNNVNINAKDERLVRHTVPGNTAATSISGHKTFMLGFKTFKLKSSGGLNGILPQDLVSGDCNATLPALVVRNLNVHGETRVETIDDLDISEFLTDCVYLEHHQIQLITGNFHVKGNIFATGNSSTIGINTIPGRDLVFVKNTENPIFIEDCKRFSNSIHIETDSDVETLNEKLMAQTYKENVKKYQNTTINGSMVILSEVSLDRLYAQEFFVGSKTFTLLNITALP